MKSFKEFITVNKNISQNLASKKLDKYMNSIVRFASANEKNKILKLLIKKNLDIRITDKYGNTPLEIARAYSQTENIRMLELRDGTEFNKTVNKKIKLVNPKLMKGVKISKKTTKRKTKTKKTTKKITKRKTKKMNKTMCKKFAKDPSRNPLSNRTIQEGGPKYKDIVKQCEDLNVSTGSLVKKSKKKIVKKSKKKVVKKKTKKLTKANCKKFAKTSINPLSNRTIKRGGPKHKEISKKCKKL